MCSEQHFKNFAFFLALDGSGTPEQKKQQLQPYQASPSPSPQVQPQAQASTPSPSTTSKFNGFTTQSTIKPACASCGYVTTPSTPAGQPRKFEFQTPAFRERQGQPNPSVSSPGALSPVPNNGGASTGPSLSSFGQSNGGVNSGSSVSTLGQNSGGASFGPASANYQQQQLQQGPESGPQQSPLSVNVPLEENQAPQYSPVQNLQTSYQQGVPSQQNQASPQSQYSPNQNQVDYGDAGVQTPLQGAVSAGSSTAGQSPSARLSQVSVSDGVIRVPGNPDIPIRDKYPNMQDGLPKGIEENDITDLLYKFNYTVGFQGHYEKGYKNGAKVGGYFVNGRDGISRVVTYVADENGYQPKVKFINLGLDSPDTPKEATEKSFGLKNFEFVWYPVS